MRSIVSAITILTVLRRLLANRALWRLWFYVAAVSRKGCTNITSRYYHNYNTAFSCIYFQINQGTAIRLVVIHPGSGDEPIRCHLMHTKLGERAYEALSYEWKEESDDDPMINVNGGDITFRKNFGALRVIVWLGSAAEKSDTTLRMIKEIAVLAVLRTTDRKSNEEHYCNQLGQLSGGSNHEYWKALVALCQPPYWCRIWVLQEIHLAKSYEVHCGKKSIGSSGF
ncbi:putative ankyrin repeat and sam domain containing protein 6 protein [Botrytis fragariae]|uniref:Putative ankyrin repeat and sam domain containing protein 6 protein n=1 Tax=Botrytis fragariae TaxID=1964551 RepID=A0A8H6EGM0_9HELO|nr:putative ankyrin repeat and sam domain containing protein 6 protein [Botrytis fragariae]KAF5871170.1 putative ankyrin repeat and sam domain containing protein 6 protein [Botrytis fragariae]